MNTECSVCGRSFRSPQGLAGHRRLVHPSCSSPASTESSTGSSVRPSAQASAEDIADIRKTPAELRSEIKDLWGDVDALWKLREPLESIIALLLCFIGCTSGEYLEGFEQRIPEVRECLRGVWPDDE